MVGSPYSSSSVAKKGIYCFHYYYYYTSGDYSLLYNFLSSYDWSCVYREASVDSAVTQLNAAVSEAMHLAVPYKCIRKSKYLCWFSNTLTYYI
jgi:hypothetical protein